ncbi:MAG: PadR family transcriptional regulator [Lachnospiraceae bacterium]
MSLPFGLLGLLKYQDNTGYDLAKMFEDSLNSFWHAQSSQIYRELNRMEDKGWVTSKNVIQNTRPNKRVYSITQDGLSAFDKWMNENTALFENPHDPLLIRVFFGANSPEVALETLKAYRDMCLTGLEEQVSKFQTSINNYQSTIPDGKDESLYWQMTLDFAVAQTKANLQWAQECIEKLEKRLKE